MKRHNKSIKPQGEGLYARLALEGVLAGLAGLAFLRLLSRRVVVRGWSMYPSLAPGDHILFLRLGEPGRGDIVLASHASRPGLLLVKRLAGLPGDVFAGGTDPRKLGSGEYALLGDAVDFSTDSRELGAFKRSDIQAKAWLRIWPLGRAGFVR